MRDEYKKSLEPKQNNGKVLWLDWDFFSSPFFRSTDHFSLITSRRGSRDWLRVNADYPHWPTCPGGVQNGINRHSLMFFFSVFSPLRWFWSVRRNGLLERTSFFPASLASKKKFERYRENALIEHRLWNLFEVSLLIAINSVCTFLFITEFQRDFDQRMVWLHWKSTFDFSVGKLHSDVKTKHSDNQ